MKSELEDLTEHLERHRSGCARSIPTTWAGPSTGVTPLIRRSPILLAAALTAGCESTAPTPADLAITHASVVDVVNGDVLLEHTVLVQ